MARINWFRLFMVCSFRAIGAWSPSGGGYNIYISFLCNNPPGSIAKEGEKLDKYALARELTLAAIYNGYIDKRVDDSNRANFEKINEG